MKYLYFMFLMFFKSFAADWKELGIYEYKVFNDEWLYKDSFDEFQQLCAKEGGELAILKDESVAQLVMEFPTIQSVIIGLEPNSASSYGFAWTDGTLAEDGYMNWSDGEPTITDNQQCVLIISNEGNWKDDACAGPKHYACQRLSGATAPPAPSSSSISDGSTDDSNSASSSSQSESAGKPVVTTTITTDSPSVITTTTTTTTATTKGNQQNPGLDQYKIPLIVVSCVSGVVIVILVVVIFLILFVCGSSQSRSRNNSYSDKMGTSRQSTTFGSEQTNMSYMWNSLSYSEDKKRKRDIPRPSVVGSASTHSYLNKAFPSRPYNQVELGYLPEDEKPYSTNGEVEHGEFNHMYAKLNAMR